MSDAHLLNMVLAEAGVDLRCVQVLHLRTCALSPVALLVSLGILPTMAADVRSTHFHP